MGISEDCGRLENVVGSVGKGWVKVLRSLAG